jgi:hypothetical protein
MVSDEHFEKLGLYFVIFNVFFENHADFNAFARLIHSARHITNEKADGRLHHIAQELHTLVEWTEDDPEVLAEINKRDEGDKRELYLSVEQAMPQLQRHYDEICAIKKELAKKLGFPDYLTG